MELKIDEEWWKLKGVPWINQCIRLQHMCAMQCIVSTTFTGSDVLGEWVSVPNLVILNSAHCTVQSDVHTHLVHTDAKEMHDRKTAWPTFNWPAWPISGGTGSALPLSMIFSGVWNSFWLKKTVHKNTHVLYFAITKRLGNSFIISIFIHQ